MKEKAVRIKAIVCLLLFLVQIGLVIGYRGVFLKGDDVPVMISSVAVSVLVFVICSVILLRRSRKKTEIKEDDKKIKVMKKVLAVLLFALFLIVVSEYCVIMLQMIHDGNAVVSDFAYTYINLLIVSAFVLFFILLFNSVTAGFTAGVFFFFFWAVVNGFVLRFRGIPFQWIDFFSVGTAANVAGKYKYTPDTWMVFFAVACISILIIAVTIGRIRLFSSIKGKISSRIGALAVAMMTIFILFRTDAVEGAGMTFFDWLPQYTYHNYGVCASFFAYARRAKLPEPEEYSSANVAETVASSAKWETDDTLVIPDNIICIMDEAFSDMSIYPSLSVDQELCPNFKKLASESIQGDLYVSVLGGTTANTEYEFLTSNSCYMAPQLVAYNSYVNNDQASLVRILKKQGYETVALHPYLANGWNREIVYPRMGFDRFLSIDDFKASERESVRGMMTDKADFDKVISLVEEKPKGQKLFLFNITMQNHSDYDDEDYESTVKVKNFVWNGRKEAEQYLSLVQKTDEALKDLIDYFRDSDEKTLILFFGDHQPSISEEFFEYSIGKKANEITFADRMMQYRTKYMVWANYDLPDVGGRALGANALSQFLLSLTGLEGSDYQAFVKEMSETIPAMNAHCYLDAKGEIRDYESASGEESEWLKKYRWLMYNELTGGAKRDESFFMLGEKDGTD